MASFTASLRTAIGAAGGEQAPDVVRVVEEARSDPARAEVVQSLVPDSPASVRTAAETLSGYGAVLLQHEFGIYGHRHGRAVVDLAEMTTAPLIVTLHTVTEEPPDGHRAIIESLAARSARVVVMSEVARRYLSTGYGVDPADVEVIPHGTTVVPPRPAVDGGKPSQGPAPTLLTWGLLGPGKGLEWAILATGLLRRRYPHVRLVIAGTTHPKVVESEGETYRESLQEMVGRLGLEAHVSFIDEYLPREAIHRLMRSAAVVVLPYDSTEQTSSGVLVEAITAQVPVVATEFPQAAEMAEAGAVMTVPHHEPERLAEAITTLLADEARAHSMVLSQARVSEASTWSEVGRRYLHLVKTVTAGTLT